MKTAYEKVQAARAKGRRQESGLSKGFLPILSNCTATAVLRRIQLLSGGIARLRNRPVTVIAMEKGGNTKEKVFRNFGSPNPEGYRKALRLMRQAEKFHRPVICFVDTSGAFCGIGAEERGQGQAIAENLMEMMGLRVPIIAVLIGEGGSGGALALAVGDEVWMLENAFYSVISPEGCASILWKDAKKNKEAAECLKLTAEDMKQMKVIERIIPEEGLSFPEIFAYLEELLWKTLGEKALQNPDQLLAARYERFRKYGRIE